MNTVIKTYSTKLKTSQISYLPEIDAPCIPAFFQGNLGKILLKRFSTLANQTDTMLYDLSGLLNIKVTMALFLITHCGEYVNIG